MSADDGGGPTPGKTGPRRAGSAVLEFLTDTVGEFVVAVVACVLFAGAAAGLVWGWQRSVTATAGLVVAVVALLANGAWNLRPTAGRSRGQLATVAVLFVVVVAVWLSYVLNYCSCM